MASIRDRLKEVLLDSNLINEEQLNRAIDEQRASGQELTAVLLHKKWLDDVQIANILSQILDLPVINISRMNIDEHVIHLMSLDFVKKSRVFPVSLMGDHLTLAMFDPSNIFVIDNVKTLSGFEVNPVIARLSDIETAIARYYEGKSADSSAQQNQESFDDIIKDMEGADADDIELVGKELAKGDKNIEEITDEAPIIKLTDTIIKQSVQAKASDVFIEPLAEETRVRYRIDGVIREMDRFPKVLHNPIISRIKVISNLDISEHRLPQDGRFKTILSGNRAVDFRVNVLPTVVGEKIVLRVLDQNSSILDVSTLGFQPESLEALRSAAFQPHGLILTCGPTGSGKTTTLYSVMKLVDDPTKNLVTVEDPVEYQVKGINQVNVKANLGLTFARCLRSILRQDPDVVLIGEIRDSETLDIAVKAALTGHLVLSSLHTTTAAGSVVRMMNMGIEPFLICSSVLCIVAQRLLRRVCPKCREEYVPSESLIKQTGLDRILNGQQDVKIFKPKGCDHCTKTGYKGRVGIHEILTLTPKVREVILKREGEVKLKQVGRMEGMITMREDALRKTLSGLTTLEEVLRLTAPDDPLPPAGGLK
jgi:type IV pilus assembly protein PilB